ncbi:DNA-3-methyladenine glycosylase [Actinopolyspora erythraea]|uniref:Putative 3-methyladenine DNA glycosylase n=1 Tax=Actinopolyspora erythraea TaxID=414996 RepID=A0A223RRR8_9ACTN|nr:DNA-3-methyladenine glycosylase [Actinopolyspora erythraea]ASU78547.1 DNA-3-methyladenine glycosylase [Actinopolyspora erythraea]
MAELTRSEIARDPLLVARFLLGCELVSTSSEGVVRVRLVEVEAYRGADDPASHCYRGRTERNAVMFGPAGHLYVYFVYGMHFCLNVVCLTEGVPAAVLLRAGEVLEGEELARRRRPAVRKDTALASGPARLAGVLGITREWDGTDLLRADSRVRLLRGSPVEDGEVRSGPRVGVSTATELPWRSWVHGSRAVSSYRRGGRRTASNRG